MKTLSIIGGFIMSQVQSVDRSFFLLEYIAKNEPVSLNELVEAIGLSKTTVHRLVSALIENKYVEKNNLTHQYSLSFKLFQLGNSSLQKNDYLNIAKSLISKLSNEINETCHLVIEDHQEVLYIEKFTPNNMFKAMASKVGQRAPMYCTAVGKSILSTYDNERIKAIWEQTDITAYTDNTITNFDDFMQEIETIRQQGYAEDKEENEKGITCVGTFFVNYKNEVKGAISLSFSTSQLDKKDLYVKNLTEVATNISKHLGYDN
jgi:IclR family KDG regulon transcriptional repressor